MRVGSLEAEKESAPSAEMSLGSDHSVTADPRSRGEHPPTLVCAGDDRVSLAMTVMLYSALKNLRGQARVEIYLLDAGISPANRRRMQRVLAPLRAELRWISVFADAVRELPVRNHVTAATYFRLLIPELLARSVNTAIYLDSDVLVEGDLSELWRERLNDNYLLAVQGRGRKKFVATSPLADIPEVEFNSDAQYFNAGVLVMNLARLREDDVSTKALNFCQTWRDVILHADQDALNAMSIGKWRSLDPKWNQFVNEGKNHSFRYFPAGILHFSGDSKPWLPLKTKYYDEGAIGGAHRLYDQYLRKSGWFTPLEWQWHRLKVAYSQRVRRPLQMLSWQLGSRIKRLMASRA